MRLPARQSHDLRYNTVHVPAPGHYLIAAGVTNDPSIPKVADDLRLVTEYFTRELNYTQALPELVDSPTSDGFRKSLSAWFRAPERHPDDRIVLYFSGHGELDPQDNAHYLILSDSDPEDLPGSAFETSLLAKIPFAGQARTLMVILDTCYSGTGTADAAVWAAKYAPESGSLLLLISSTRKKDPALDGAFLPAFLDAARNATAARGRYVQQYLAVGSLLEHVKAKLPPYQKATWLFAPAQSGDVLSPIRNPQYDSRIPPGLDLEDQEHYRHALEAHFIPRAQGGETMAPDSNIWYFTGREQALREICLWLRQDQPNPRLLVVTGGPGMGKSALLGRLVTLADPDIRDQPLAQTPLREDTIPPPNAFHAAIHLRNLQIRQVADLLTATLALPPLDPKLLDAYDLGIALGQQLAKRKEPACLLFDALDEAADPKPLWRSLLQPLSTIPHVRLVIGARPLFEWGTAKLIDLNDARYLGETDVEDYIARRLLAEEEPDRPTAYRRQPELARTVARAAARKAGKVFLVARITSRLLLEAEEPVDTTAEGWAERLPSNTAEAFEEYLSRFGPDAPRVRDILLPLAFAEGQGLPWESIWPALASKLSGRAYGHSDIREVLAKAGRSWSKASRRGAPSTASTIKS